jgi:hypothetical protein
MDIHVLNGNDDGTSYLCAFHFPVSEAVNQAGISYRTIISVYENDTKSIVPNITSEEQQKLNNGEILEDVVSFATNPARTDQQERIVQLYQSRKVYWQTNIPNKYKWTGATLSGTP